ncbi:hypothetical protein ACRAWF_06655 [Streptomyces sp. L7]
MTSAGELALVIPLYEENLTEQAACFRPRRSQDSSCEELPRVCICVEGDCSRAIDLYKEALDDYIRVLGEDHSDTLISRRESSYAAAYKEAGKLAWAIPYTRRLLPPTSEPWVGTTPAQWPASGNLPMPI